jgi:hypothetical protein
LIYPFRSLWIYFEQTGQEPAYFDLARRAAEKSDAPVFAYHYALALYRRGRFAEALRALDQGKWKVLAGKYLRTCILAELHPQDQSLWRAAYQESDQQLLCLLGYKNEAVAISRAQRQQSTAQLPLDEPLKRRLDYFCGDISDNEYLKIGDRSTLGAGTFQGRAGYARVRSG